MDFVYMCEIQKKEENFSDCIDFFASENGPLRLPCGKNREYSIDAIAIMQTNSLHTCIAHFSKKKKKK